jgi:hypothetical protein
MADIFLSYSTEDHEKVRKLADALKHEGWDVFWDRGIPVGKNWGEVIEEELPRAKAITSLWSSSSVKSNYVWAESNYGLQHKKLLPAMIGKADVPILFSLIEYADLTKWDGVSRNHTEFLKLIDALKYKAGDPTGSVRVSPQARLVETGKSPAKIFVGYSRRDRVVAEKLVRGLKKRGFSLYWDAHIPVGESVQAAIAGAIESSKAVIIIWTNNGVESAFVNWEAAWALEHSKLVGVMTEAVSLPPKFGIAPVANFIGWDGSTNHPAFVRLVQTLTDIDVNLRDSQRDVRRKRVIMVVFSLIVVIFVLGVALGMLAMRLHS